MTSRALARIMDDFPNISIHKVELLTNPARSLRAGVRSIPSLVSDDKSLKGMFLNEKKIRSFLESL
ncbi:MAG: hypothetical protein PF442_04420 [Desulfobulbaceae bacterium]|jgi:hypothetical protein|nr:hypothetical protein [Desulfobulbaceae bacterium]